MKKIFVLIEKYGNIIVGPPFETAEEKESLAAKIIKSRIDEGWYDDTQTSYALELIEEVKALQFLETRNNYEYEEVRVENLVIL